MIELNEGEVLVAIVDVQGVVNVGYDVEELFNDILVSSSAALVSTE